jgi:hypothetical protein
MDNSNQIKNLEEEQSKGQAYNSPRGCNAKLARYERELD